MAAVPLLELRDARVARDGNEILHVTSLAIRQGEHIAVLGPNGAGKSTLIGLLTREVAPLYRDPPSVLFLGRARLAVAEARGLLGTVSASAQEMVHVHLPVEQVVLGGRFGALGVPPHLRRRVTEKDMEATRRALDEVGIGHLAARDMRTLSTGEARRTLVARALVHDPQVLVLDEPCAGLDPTAAWHLRELMRRLAAGGRTLVLVTHHIEDLVREIDRVVLMAAGRVVADGPKREVLSARALSELFGVPFRLEEHDGEYRLW